MSEIQKNGLPLTQIQRAFKRIEILTAERDSLICALDEEMAVCHLGVFDSRDDPVKTIKTLMQWSQRVGEYFAKDEIIILKAERDALQMKLDGQIAVNHSAAAEVTELRKRIATLTAEKEEQYQSFLATSKVKSERIQTLEKQIEIYKKPVSAKEWVAAGKLAGGTRIVHVPDAEVCTALIAARSSIGSALGRRK